MGGFNKGGSGGGSIAGISAQTDSLVLTKVLGLPRQTAFLYDNGQINVSKVSGQSSVVVIADCDGTNLNEIAIYDVDTDSFGSPADGDVLVIANARGSTFTVNRDAAANEGLGFNFPDSANSRELGSGQSMLVQYNDGSGYWDVLMIVGPAGGIALASVTSLPSGEPDSNDTLLFVENTGDTHRVVAGTFGTLAGMFSERVQFGDAVVDPFTMNLDASDAYSFAGYWDDRKAEFGAISFVAISPTEFRITFGGGAAANAILTEATGDNLTFEELTTGVDSSSALKQGSVGDLPIKPLQCVEKTESPFSVTAADLGKVIYVTGDAIEFVGNIDPNLPVGFYFYVSGSVYSGSAVKIQPTPPEIIGGGYLNATGAAAANEMAMFLKVRSTQWTFSGSTWTANF